MKAVSQHEFGGPEVLRIVEVPEPVPGPGEVVLRMAAAAVNPVDWKIRAGHTPLLGEPPFTLGFDVAGTITGLGPGVTEFRPGDRAFGMIFSRTGAYSEYVIARAKSLAPIPPGLDPMHAAALSTAGLTAWQALNLAELHSGERILIHAGAGGVGHLAVQFAAQRGATVIATARTANHDFVRSLGAIEAIDYTTTDFTKSVTEVHTVLDLVGGTYGTRSLRVLSPTGRYLTAQDSDAIDDPRCRRITGHPSRADLTTIADLAAAGKLTVHVARTFPLHEAAAAHRLAESGEFRGKLVLTHT